MRGGIFFFSLCLFKFSVVIRLFLAPKQERRREEMKEGEGEWERPAGG